MVDLGLRMFVIAGRRVAPVCLLALTLSVSWLPGAAAQEPPAGAVNLARELLQLRGATSLFDAVVPGVIETAKNTFLQTNPGLSKDLNDVATQFRNEFSKKTAELQNEVAKVYAKTFTEQEIREAIAFYRTPLGKKLTADEPQALDQMMATAQSWADRFSDDIVARFRAEMKKKGHDI
jgi:uncharacterized protein